MTLEDAFIECADGGCGEGEGGGGGGGEEEECYSARSKGEIPEDCVIGKNYMKFSNCCHLYKMESSESRTPTRDLEKCFQ